MKKKDLLSISSINRLWRSKFLRCMKALLFLILVGTVQSFAFSTYAQSTRLSLDYESESIINILEKIEEQTEFYFMFDATVVDVEQQVTVKCEKSTIKDVLDLMFDNTGITYNVNDRIIALSSGDGAYFAQPKNITGKVTDEQGLPLPGVTVVVKGTTRGTTTGADGNYALAGVDVGTTLVFSFVGMTSQEILVGSQSIIDVALVADAIGIEEVVAIGYGTKSVKTTTGAVSQISGELLESRPLTNSISGLQGAIAGVTINRGSGQPGQENFTLQVRGASSVSAGGNSPLVLIDGIEGDINNLNPNDIESTTVLKDASAAIYGARAAGGVILITTKTGRNNQPISVRYNGSYSMNNPSNFIDLVNMKEYAEMQIEAVEATGGSSEWAIPEVWDAIQKGEQLAYALWGPGENARIFTKETDWRPLLYKDFGSQWNHNLRMSGGGEKSNYNISVGYLKVDGILKDAYDSSDRLNLRFNYSFDVTEKLKMLTKLSYENKKTVQPSVTSENIFHHVTNRFVWLPNRTEDGSNYLTQWGYNNPRQLADKESGKLTQNLNNLNVNIKLEYDLFDGLKAHGQLGVVKEFYNEDSYGPVIRKWFWGNQPAGLARRRSFARVDRDESLYKNLTGYLDYRKLIDNKHQVGIMVGGSHEKKEKDMVATWRRDFTQTELWSLGLGSVEEQYNGQAAYHWAISSMFSRLSYSFASKYNAELNYRRDGSSVFSSDVRWGDFYGAALSWRASEEEFIKNLGIFDNLKARLSHGTSGNQDFNEDNGNFYDYVPLIDIGGVYPFGGTERAPGASERKLVSQVRTWEEITTTNFGIDFALLDSRLFGNFDIYKKKNANMLLGVNLPSVLGGAPPAQNVGTLETKGFELSLGWKGQVNDDFSYSIIVSLDDNTNKLVDLDGADLAQVNRQYNREGYAIGTYFGYEFDGFIQNQAELDAYKQLDGVPSTIGIGDTRFKDLNNDGRISPVDADGNDADIVDLGTNASRYNYSINISAKYKGFDFSAFLQGVGKRTIYYSGGYHQPWFRPWLQPLKRFYGNTWTPENPDAKYPRLTMGDTNANWNYWYSSMNKINGAYLRVKNIQLGYTIPNNVTEKAGFRDVRFYVSGEDLFTIDHVDGGYDAENTRGGHANYPFMKRYAIGVSLTF